MTTSEHSERPTVRPVTLGRLVESTYLCVNGPRTTEEIETALDVTNRRARETILESERLGLIEERTNGETDEYQATHVGKRFLGTVRDADWARVSDYLEAQSPHYRAFLEALTAVSPASLEEVLAELEAREASTDRSYNQTSVEVIGDWGERLNAIQRHAFTGTYYPVEAGDVPATFPQDFIAVFDDLEETAGVDLRQRYLSIPELREAFCERHSCQRAAFDAALQTLASQNVGRLELSGAPVDTGAKEARLGIKEIDLDDGDGLVRTTQSTERVMAGIEQFDKQYYYVAIHDRDLTYDPPTEHP